MTEEPHLVEYPSFMGENRFGPVVEFLGCDVCLVTSSHV